MSVLTKFILSLIVVGVLVVGVVLLQPATQQDDDRFRIVTTFYPITALTEPVVGDAARIDQLVPSGQGVHDYQPSPSNLAALAKADLLILNGADLEHEWLEPLLESAEQTPRLLDLAQALEEKGITLLEGEHEHGHEEEAAADDHGHELATDPHLWVSPKNAIAMVEAISDTLVVLDPDHADTYQTSSYQLLSQLRDADLEIRDKVATFSQKGFIAFHNAFSYYARDYGLTQLAAIELTPGESPTPGQLSEIRALVAEHRLRGLFTEPQFSSDVVDQLAADLGIIVRELDPIETSEDNTSYLEIQRRNLEDLDDVLG